eukprot:TRINITY_DN10772_c0_g1_i3.p4 TRINITY_DN10772_c0_g1~~TRINITY_DN10772_c0_g1_i3.p4  ORF type:complete len:133 (+),score=20.88 TRINITY_DN10772_c0_g1_i3:868-1266(+)
MLACSVQTEIEQQTRRLRHQPCIAVWCGSNEIEANNLKNASYRPGYVKLNYDTVMTTIRSLDPQRALWPSSPSNGFNKSSVRLLPRDWGMAESTHYGDMHHYIYNDNCWNRYVARSCMIALLHAISRLTEVC